ncbi:MAG: helix-turn-helix domain-containing protein [Pseudomonadota bacterium]
MYNDSPLPLRLRQARQRKGLSQRRLGLEAGLDEFSASPRINHYERGRHAPNYSTLNRLAGVLEVPVPFFFAEDDDLADWLLLWRDVPQPVRQQTLSQLRNFQKKE